MAFESQALEQAGNKQLDKLAAEFYRWRSQKKSQAERIPIVDPRCPEAVRVH